MSTSYYIELGYNGGFSSQLDRDEQWEVLKSAVLEIREHPERIWDEARAFGAPEEDDDGETLESYCERYRPPATDQTIYVEDTADRRYVVQMASGGEPARLMKEHVRRAFCRLVIYAMHRQSIEVNLTVS